MSFMEAVADLSQSTLGPEDDGTVGFQKFDKGLSPKMSRQKAYYTHETIGTFEPKLKPYGESKEEKGIWSLSQIVIRDIERVTAVEYSNMLQSLITEAPIILWPSNVPSVAVTHNGYVDPDPGELTLSILEGRLANLVLSAGVKRVLVGLGNWSCLHRASMGGSALLGNRMRRIHAVKTGGDAHVKGTSVANLKVDPGLSTAQ
ncbi:hypothetical protein DFH09DRAFT_1102167 [Mycena vulgaris]|nr:hypothetical protein DFH09DRAFT_1102167 [Mycena vulgaris]